MKDKKIGLITCLILMASLLIGILYKSNLLKNKSLLFWVADISRFCINDLCLEKKDADWLLNKGNTIYPANNELVESYVKRFSAIELKDEVSNNPDNFSNFGINGSKKVLIEIDGKKLEIGSIASDYMGTYVREENSDKIFLIPTVYEKNTLLTTEYWAQKYLTNMSKTQIKKVVVAENSKESVSEPNEGKWKNDKKISLLAQLPSEKYWQDKKPESIEEIGLKIESEDKTIFLMIGKTKDGKFWASNDTKFFFEINEANYNLLTEKTN